METVRSTLRLDKALDKKVSAFAYKYKKSKNWVINMLTNLGLLHAKDLEKRMSEKKCK